MLHFLNIITIYLKYEFLHLLNNFSSMPFAQLKNKLTTQTYRAGFLALNYCVTILFNIFIGHIKSLIPLIISIESVRNPNNGDHSHFQEDGKVSEQIATSFKKSVFSEFHLSQCKQLINYLLKRNMRHFLRILYYVAMLDLFIGYMQYAYYAYLKQMVI